jgi:hypothetical protein
MNKQDIANALKGFTVVLNLQFSVEVQTGECQLTLNLARSERHGDESVEVDFMGVTNLSIKEFGGGITQLLLLSVEDVRDKQWDNIYYYVSEVENESISFFYREASVKS